MGLGVVLFWTLGSFMQSLVTEWFAPNIAHHQIPAAPVTQNQVQKSLHEVLAQHNITGFRNFRYVEMNGKYYYQLKNTFNHLLYFDAVTGAQLAHGDELYAMYLGRFFTGDQQSPVQVTLLKNFTRQYPQAHRLLPVYQVSFDRPDRLTVYIEPAQSRLSAYNTRGMRTFNRILDTFYPSVLAGSASEDVYSDDENPIFGIADIRIETTELPWQATGAYNASIVRMPQGIFYQLFGYDHNKQPYTYYVHASTGEMLSDGEFIYARYLANKFKNFKTKVDAGVSFSCCLPQDTIPDGTQIKKAGIIATELITSFDSSYSSAHKRLPVIKVTYKRPEDTSFYIETSSSTLAAVTESSEQKNQPASSYMAQVVNWFQRIGREK